MFEVIKNLERRLKIVVGVLLFLVVCVLLNFLIQKYFVNIINKNWPQISAEKEVQLKDDCIKLFQDYQNQTLQLTHQVSNNKKLINALYSQNPKRAYESVTEISHEDDYNFEIYNSRLELFIFSGRQLKPEISELQRALKGESFSLIKEVGFYTFLICYKPLINENDSLEFGSNKTLGVLLVGKVLEVNYNVKNALFKNNGFTYDVLNTFNLNAELKVKPYSQQKATQLVDTSKEFQTIELKGISRETIADLLLPHLDKYSYIDNVKENFQKFNSILIFSLNICFIVLILFFLRKLKPLYLKGLIISITLILSRYFWLLINFPSDLFRKSLSEVFSPTHYASGFAFGIGKSLGELFITSLVALIICSILIFVFINNVKKEIYFKKWYYQLASLLILIFIFVFSIHIYGIIIQSLVNDSNLNYFDRTQIIPTDHPELIIGQFIILLFSISLILILVVCFLNILKYITSLFHSVKFLKRNLVSVIIIAYVFINLMIYVLVILFFDYSVAFGIRNLIIILVSLFGYYIQRQLYLNELFKFNTVLNYSMIALICIIFIPLILLTKITSQENRYLELIARKVSEKEEDKITSLIITTLDDVSDDRNLESDILNKNKFPKLAFNIWGQSTFYSEDLNTGIFVLDTAKKLISDFNINPEELNSDSVLSNAISTLKSNSKKSKSQMSANLVNENDNDVSDDESETVSNDIIYQNTELKFFYGIRPIERINLKNSKFNKVLGYIIIAAQYDAKNFLTQAGIQIFRNFSRDNLVNKLTSIPELSEYKNGELISSTNKDLARAFSKYLEPFKESVNGKVDKSTLRYDQFENKLYKSFYLLTNFDSKNESNENIYVVSIRANDFGMMTFFFFKYLLFVVVIFVLFVVFYLIFKIVFNLLTQRTKTIFKFGFREKIFSSFIVVSVIPIIVLALYSRGFVTDKNIEFYKSQMISDLKLVEQYIKRKSPLFETSKLRQNYPSEISSIENVFGKGFSESHKNFNLYIYTKLVSTTDEQLYKADLIDNRISGSAYYNISLLKKDFYFENSSIGDLNVIAAYKPIFDNYNNLLGILSSQTVFKQYEINQELTENLVYIFGVYFIAVIFLIIIVNILSYTISNPIIRLQKATDQLSKGNIEIEVKSTSKDEIGELISSFNRMTKELKRSREQLKRAERESAWRDIARQVAHEIKNPLTPMKLAMQYLYYAYSKGSNDFKSILQTTNRLIIDQIETLNRIATEFSDFAKMPSRNYVPININSILVDVVNLLNTQNKIKLNSSYVKEEIKVIGDEDEIKRALINILRNALHAIEESVCNRNNGFISINTNKVKDSYSIIITDNGIGMDEITLQKLFEPYFSTKSSGMGLGLVITKKIIDDMDGKIFLKSQLNEGTEVRVVFKIQNNLPKY